MLFVKFTKLCKLIKFFDAPLPPPLLPQLPLLPTPTPTPTLHVHTTKGSGWIEEYNFTGECQAGLKQDYSTIHHMYTSMASVQRQYNLNPQLYIPFIDFEKFLLPHQQKFITVCSVLIYRYPREAAPLWQGDVSQRPVLEVTEYINCSFGVRQGDA